MMCRVMEFDPSDVEGVEVLNGGKNWRDKLLAWSRGPNSYVYTLFDEGMDVVCFFGGTLIQSRSMSAWSILTPLVYTRPKSFHKAFKTFIDRHFKEHDLLRMQTTVDKENEAAHRHNERLGFECEALLRKFGPNGEDQYLYTRFS